ncbi:tetratricopeptide repeat protein [Halomonas denitrificans]|uniref:O-linked N-acetylglucosamine transferase, SPINDLY family protein n=1 Tax=Halomonas denitrificans TaxID=370769 RepID=UPI001C9A2AD2|nr:tetratricopeptide repeat protein [Halomonas denitrificans]MBY5967883.1 tetratricopeptide repeat protein [Halomonas denitrificans]
MRKAIHRPPPQPARNSHRSAQKALEVARKNAAAAPGDADKWRRLGEILLDQQRPREALEPLATALSLSKDDHKVLALIGIASYRAGRLADAESYLNEALSQHDEDAEAHRTLGHILANRGDLSQAISHALRALEINPSDTACLCSLAQFQAEVYDLEEAKILYQKAIRIAPTSSTPWNNLGGIESQLGHHDAAIEAYQRAVSLTPNNSGFYSNLITAYHYHPHKHPREITALIRRWQNLYAPPLPSHRPCTGRRSSKQLRIGMLSDGFRGHPVARMILSALEKVATSEASFFLYTTNLEVDIYTRRLQALATNWEEIKHLDDKAFAQRVQDDQIDILFDLAGHNAGTRMRAMSLEPAPLIVKWVGGLINTTGVEAIDYLLSDAIETPPGCDDDYVEKLIRLPDDYICYEAPPYTPEVNALPAKANGYITLGCFNNGTKLNDVLLTEWATLMKQLPESRLLLKSQQFKGAERGASITAFMAEQGISEERIMIEGPSPHGELLKTYHRVDIALDPWPYSGGLTTCEAFTMGVPVVSLPGPTFAGRHSATHLINAGMPELVVSSWDEYRERVIELASDLDSLATIRRHLREVLLGSPVCDAKRFARHFTHAVRAIWQRHCEHKAPAALTFDKEGKATFEGDSAPVEIVPVEPLDKATTDDGFRWNFEGRIIVVDNGARLLKTPNPRAFLDLDAFGVVAFDPASQVKKPEFLKTRDDVDLFAHACLGDGTPGELHATLDAKHSSLLPPEPATRLQETCAQPMQCLTRLPISTIALDSIEGLPTIDWLSLDLSGDTMAILEHGEKALQDALLLQVQVPFQPLYEGQPDFAQVSHWAHRHGFRFYRFNTVQQAPAAQLSASLGASEWLSADALFIPDEPRMASLAPNRITKLAFVAHTIFHAKDLAWQLLHRAGREAGYLEAESASITTGDITDSPATEEPEDSAVRLPDAPHMTVSEQQLFLDALRKTQRYFEFGSGGSTIWATREGISVHGVESDANWVQALREACGETCKVRSVDIGSTREWGFPVDTRPDERFEAYSLAIHDMADAFDLILIDGRFRVACTLQSIIHTIQNADRPRDTRLFLHDFWDRPHYHSVLEFLEEEKRVDTAGIFRIKEGLSLDRLEQQWHVFKHDPA